MLIFFRHTLAIDTETTATKAIDTQRSTLDLNKTVSTTRHLIFGLLSLLVLIVSMGAVYLWQHHKVDALSNQLNNYQATLVKDYKISLYNLNALTALPNIGVDAVTNP